MQNIQCLQNVHIPNSFNIKNYINSFFVGDDNLGTRAVDEMVIFSFILIFMIYYVLSSLLAIKAFENMFLQIIFSAIYAILGLGMTAYLRIHYNDLTSTSKKGEQDVGE